MERNSFQPFEYTKGHSNSESEPDEYGALSEFENLPRSRKNELVKQFPVLLDKPVEYFSPKNLKALSFLPSAERVFLLATAGRALQVSPSLAQRQFAMYPEDAKLIETLFVARRGLQKTGLEQMLFSLSFNNLNTDSLEQSNVDEYRLKVYDAMCDRRERAPAIMMGAMVGAKGFKPFGAGADGILQALQHAEQLEQSGNERIDLEKLFSADFESLDPKQQAALLRLTVAEIHNSLVFHEKFKSVFDLCFNPHLFKQ